ncbi:MAG TPA: DUF1571 domain-containing protein [Planctomycetaceae bacterium]|jgi:hypothetical protein
MKRLKQVWQLRRAIAIPPGAPRLNCLAALISGLALGILYLTFHAKPAGAGHELSARAAPQLQACSPPAESTADGASSSGLSTLSPEELNQRMNTVIHSSRLALQLHVALLEVGKHRIERFPDYSATFIKQERVDGSDLQDVQSIQLKLRHKPFGIYMKWLEGGDVGRELLHVEGQYDDKMLVRLGGIKKRLPLLKLEPTGSLAMQESRHPVTEMGLALLADQILKYRKRDLTLKAGLRWEMLPEQKFMDRTCDCWVVEYDSREVEPVYRKSITYIDKELSLPVCVRSFGWPEAGVEAADTAALDEATLIEYYGYTDIKFESRLTDSDFDKGNSGYTFRR